MENLSLFDSPQETQEQIRVEAPSSLPVVKMEFAGGGNAHLAGIVFRV